MDSVALVIPSLEPKEEFIDFLKDIKKTIKTIIIVNDGSSNKYDTIFKKIIDEKIVVLTHKVNLGKGQALKTAFSYILNKYNNIKVIVTADSDLQHIKKDIIKCGEAALNNPKSMIIGARNFDLDKVPSRNRTGNIITRIILNSFYGIKITDTQSGLRAFSIDIAKKIIDIKGNRFEYETNVLIETKEINIPIKEVKIDTIYLKDSNKNSHFNIFVDSYRIYSLFTKKILIAITSFIINILLFIIMFQYLNEPLFLSLIFAKIISNSSYILMNKNREYNDKYFILELINFVISSTIIYIISFYTNQVIIYKVIIDIIIFLFMMSYKITSRKY